MSVYFRLLYHVGVLTLAVIWAFIWLRTPALSHYSLQLFAAVIVSYFVVKRINQAEFWQLLPSPVSVEMGLATLAFLLVIGATGNVQSPLFPLSFVHLAFLAISAESLTAVIILLQIMLFHYSLTPHVGMVELSYLSSLPIVLVFFLLAKNQFARLSRRATTQPVDASPTQTLPPVDQALEQFVSKLLRGELPGSYRSKRSAVLEEKILSPTSPELLTSKEIEPLIDLELNDAQAEAEAIADEITDTLDLLNYDSRSSKAKV